MPWKQVRPMDEKIRFISDHLMGVFTFAELCDRYGISRKTGYKWVDRYMEHGVDGLKNRSRKPHRSPSKTTLALEEAVVTIRHEHPTWGPKKIRVQLEGQRRPEPILSESTITRILRRHGCITKPRPRRRRAHPGKPTTVATTPNHLWCADFKGQFKTRDGVYCYPLTVTDAYSRYVLTISGFLSPDLAHTKPAFEWLFTTYGVPDRIRTDNGTPFASTALGRLSQLSVWWIQLGILPELIELGHPEQNGRHERMHRTLKAEATRPPEADMTAQQQRFDAFQREFNQERPHEALQQATPASVYTVSAKKMPSAPKLLDYPAHFEVRIVSTNSGIRWKSGWVSVSHILAGQPIGLEAVDEGLWEVWYGPVRLGRLDERLMGIRDT
jgi:putative transposase